MSLELEIANLIAEGYSKLIFDYDGIGDEGCIDGINALCKGGVGDYVDEDDIPLLYKWVWENIINVDWAFEEDGHGSYGHITLDLEKLEASYSTTHRHNTEEKEWLQDNTTGLETGYYTAEDINDGNVDSTLLDELVGLVKKGEQVVDDVIAILVREDGIYVTYEFLGNGDTFSKDGIALPPPSDHALMLAEAGLDPS